MTNLYEQGSALPPGFVLRNGRYRIDSILGSGGFGVTYKAWDSHLMVPVALKEFFPAGAYRDGNSVRFSSGGGSSDGFGVALEDFLREARLLARMRDPNVVTLLDHFEDLGTGIMVMEFLEGRTYADVVASNGPLAVADASAVLAAVGSGLMAVHRQGLVHRDVKPANIMGTWDGRVVLIDFGASRVWSSRSADVSKALVSDGFSPIEQYATGPLSQRSDTYALAATGYYLLTGRSPVPAVDRAGGTLQAPVASIRPDVPPHVSAAIDYGLAIRADDRPGSVEEFLGCLRGDVVTRLAPASPKQDLTMTTLVGATPPSIDHAPVKQQRSAFKWVAIGALPVLAIAGVGVMLTNGGPGPSTDVTVPTTTVQVSTAAPVDTVPVTPTVAAMAAPTVTVPDLAGADVGSAQQVAAKNGLALQLEYSYSSSVAKGYIIRQDPAAGALAPASIVVTVSNGAPPAPAPSPVAAPSPAPVANYSTDGFASPQDFVRYYYETLINNGRYEEAFAHLTPHYQSMSGGWSGFTDWWTRGGTGQRMVYITSFGSCSWTSTCSFYTSKGSKIVLYLSGAMFRGDSTNRP